MEADPEGADPEKADPEGEDPEKADPEETDLEEADSELEQDSADGGVFYSYRKDEILLLSWQFLPCL